LRRFCFLRVNLAQNRMRRQLHFDSRVSGPLFAYGVGYCRASRASRRKHAYREEHQERAIKKVHDKRTAAGGRPG